MIQQIIAIIFIVFFIFGLSQQRQKNNLSRSEYVMWLFFWVFSALVVIFIKKIDALVAQIGFSSAGIEVLLYIATSVLFYLYFRIRLKIEKIEANISKLNTELSLRNKEQK